MRGLALAVLLPSALGGNSRMCIENTGGTCRLDNCMSWRGSTRCDGGRCFCTGGTCSGSDEVCSNTAYTELPATFKIRNARWPDHYMYAQNAGGLAVSKDHGDEASMFTVVTPPNPPDAAKLLRLLYSKKWPDACVYVSHTGNQGDSVLCSSVTGKMGGLFNDPAIHELGLIFTEAPQPAPEPNRTLVMLGSHQKPNLYLYVSSGSWGVGTHTNDPGAGGYWYFDPELPPDVVKSLPKYTGPRCSWRCGVAAALVSHAEFRAQVAWVFAAVALLPFLGVP
mmetsp:Transcript_10244/g.32325  ORF Transcript_10244/g.32325 Transcript_10244/m.32325 type:complete len:280 (-) Transcript_10244:101-940(-)